MQRWAEPSGNAGLTGRELPPAEVLAADQRITWWARQLRKAGLDGGMDLLRARAFLDILLGIDSRPLGTRTGNDPSHDSKPSQDSEPGQDSKPGHDSGPGHGRRVRPGWRVWSAGAPVPAPAGPLAGVIPPGFAGRANLTIPLATLLHLANRPGEMAGIGPLDPDLARDLAAAAARTARSTWCVTVTDQDGHAIGHGCARPAPARSRANPAERHKPGTATGLIRARRPVVQLHRRRTSPARPAGTAPGVLHRNPRTAGPAHRPRAHPHGPVRPPARGQGPRSRGPAPAPGPGPARHVHRAGLPPPIDERATSSTTSRTRRAAGPACVMGTRSAVTTTG